MCPRCTSALKSTACTRHKATGQNHRRKQPPPATTTRRVWALWSCNPSRSKTLKYHHASHELPQKLQCSRLRSTCHRKRAVVAESQEFKAQNSSRAVQVKHSCHHLLKALQCANYSHLRGVWVQTHYNSDNVLSRKLPIAKPTRKVPNNHNNRKRKSQFCCKLTWQDSHCKAKVSKNSWGTTLTRKKLHFRRGLTTVPLMTKSKQVSLRVRQIYTIKLKRRWPNVSQSPNLHCNLHHSLIHFKHT